MSDEKTVVSGPEFFAMIDAAAQRKVDIETLAREYTILHLGWSLADAFRKAEEFYAEVDRRNKQ